MQTTLILVSLLTIGFVSADNSESGCEDSQADIVFVLDESGSIQKEDFAKQLGFVQKTTDLFDVHFNRTHVGVLTFATDTNIIFNLGDYTEEEELKKAVRAIKQRGSGTSTHLALKRLREEMFSKKYSRSWASHVAIVITDGESNYPERTKKEARLVHKTDIEVFAIGVGRNVKRTELEAIASSPDKVYTVDNYAALESLRKTLASKACATRLTLPPTTAEPTPLIKGCAGRKLTDQIWSISDQASVEETNLAIDFINIITQDMAIAPNRIQVGLVQRFCDQGNGIQLKDQVDGRGFREALGKRRLTGDHIVRSVTAIGQLHVNGRTDAVKYGILIVDYRLENWEDALEAAQDAKRGGIRLIVIGVGDRVQQDQLRQLSSSSSHYFYARSYSELSGLKSQLIQSICEGITERSYIVV